MGDMGEPGLAEEYGLVNYGIQNEGSDIRAHVAVLARVVYVYKTRVGHNAINPDKHKLVPGRQLDKNGHDMIVTAAGYLVPPDDIPGLRTIFVPDQIWELANFDKTQGTSEKGNKAVRIVKWLLNNGRFPIWVHPEIIEDADLQISGTDILVRAKTKIQVKCDYRAGTGAPGCTGNLFLQIAESNPFKRY
jgi:hypothetical protein